MKSFSVCRIAVFPIFWTLVIFLFFSCDQVKNNLIQEKRKPRSFLTEKTFFDFRAIQRTRRDANDFDKERSKKYFNEGKKALTSSHQHYKGIHFLKKSILNFPNANAYFLLGKAWLEVKDFKNAQKAMNTAELLNYPELSRLYYALAKIHASQNHIEEANKYLKLALEKGFKEMFLIANDPVFDKLRNTETYREIIAQDVSNETERKEALFKIFISKFPTKELPFRIDRRDIEEFNYETYIPHDYEELLVDKIKSSENKDFSFVAKVATTNQYDAVIYSSIDAIEVSYEAVVETYMVIYDKKGSILDYLLFACNCSPQLSYSGAIDEKKEIRIMEFENSWKHNPATTDYMDNEIENITLRYIYHYKLTPKGKIKLEKKEEVGFVARL